MITITNITAIADLVKSRLTSTMPRAEKLPRRRYCFTAGDTWNKSIPIVVDPDTVRLILAIKPVTGATDGDSIFLMSSDVGAQRINANEVGILDAAKASLSFSETAIDFEIGVSFTAIMQPGEYNLIIKGLSDSKARTYERWGLLLIRPPGIYEVPAT